MTPNERVALAWVEKHLRIFECKKCGKHWITGRSQAALMHKCAAYRPPRPTPWSREEHMAEARKRWALTQIGGAIEEALGDRALRGDDK